MRKIYLLIIISCFVITNTMAQDNGRWKMSPLVREASFSAFSDIAKSKMKGKTPVMTAFVRVSDRDTEVFREHNSKILAQFGNICIASIPLSEIDGLASERSVMRIEAGRPCTIHMDSTAMHVNAKPVYEGFETPQAYTGKGVVMGVQDIGFDLTHPNFYSSDMKEYRIKRLWDQLSSESNGTLPVGAEYTTKAGLLAYAHVRDGLKQTHGTHTLGIAAGSGYDSPYRGMAWESDICIVANATSDDREFISDEDRYLYTSAMDALGFKYIFDYAESAGKPCVISFSEGSHQDFYGDDQLLYEVLDSLTGPGRIIVASAGNDGSQKTYFRKPRGIESAGTFLLGSGDNVYFMLKADKPFDIRTVVYNEHPDTVIIPSYKPIERPDSEYVDTLTLADGEYVFDVAGYPSCYNEQEKAYEMLIKAPGRLGYNVPLSLEVLGKEADVEFYICSGAMIESGRNPKLNAGENTHSIHSPSSAPSVICVGASGYRTGFINYKGEWCPSGTSTTGDRGSFSSVGPTLDGRTKPDVIAPGINLISSYSSYYLENNPTARDINSDVAHFEYNGRTYAWNSNSGTSMSAPVVGGAIALWLQAYPQLTPEQALEVISKTSRPTPAAQYPLPDNYEGYGEIDVYKGLLEVLRIQADGLENISDCQPTGVRFYLDGDYLRMVFSETASALPGCFSGTALTVKIYSLNGRLVLTQRFDRVDNSCAINLASLPAGVYAVQLNSALPSVTGSTLIRK